jgi:apolipoprotein N-acyltransferase
VLNRLSESRALRSVLEYFGLAKPNGPCRASRRARLIIATLYVLLAIYWLGTAALGSGGWWRWLFGFAFLLLAVAYVRQARAPESNPKDPPSTSGLAS